MLSKAKSAEVTKRNEGGKQKISTSAKATADKHPKYYPKAKVTCACGNTFEIGSTEPEMTTEICSACHPLYTGKHKFIDTAKRVDKFQERVKKAHAIKQAKKLSKAKSRSQSGKKLTHETKNKSNKKRI